MGLWRPILQGIGRRDRQETALGVQQNLPAIRRISRAHLTTAARVHIPLAGFAKAMPFDHALDRLTIHTGFLRRIAHMPNMTLQEFQQKTAFEGANHFLFGLLV